jgi:hypothetical protein
MENEKQVKIEIVSERGHDTLLLSPQQALTRIEQETTSKGKWCYIDGKYCKSDTITESAITTAQNITLVSALQGG